MELTQNQFDILHVHLEPNAETRALTSSISNADKATARDLLHKEGLLQYTVTESNVKKYIVSERGLVMWTTGKLTRASST